MDIAAIRSQTPGCGDKLFFNSAGASLITKEVLQITLDYLKAESDIGGYELAHSRSEEIATFYAELALMLNCRAQNIAFTTSATDAYFRAISSIPFKEGDYILTTQDDYISNYISFITFQHQFGVKIISAQSDKDRNLDLDDFEQKIVKYRPRCVSVTHVPSSSGLVQDVESIGLLCKKHDILYIVDACQSVGQLEVNVSKIGCDFLSATGRKFLRGPRGTGFLFVSDKALEAGLKPINVDMRGAFWREEFGYALEKSARRYEQWEVNYSTLLGLKQAVRYFNTIGASNIKAYNEHLASLMRKRLQQLNGVTLHDIGKQLCNIITWSKSGVELKELEAILKSNNVYFSIGLRENAILDYGQKGIDWAIRFSPHYFNTEDEVARLCEIIDRV